MSYNVSADFNRDATNDILHKPEYLYAYTDPNPSGETLYAWTTTTENVNIPTIYTTDLIPTNSSIFYDENGNTIDITNINNNMYAIESFNSGSSTECTFVWNIPSQQI